MYKLHYRQQRKFRFENQLCNQNLHLGIPAAKAVAVVSPCPPLLPLTSLHSPKIVVLIQAWAYSSSFAKW